MIGLSCSVNRKREENQVDFIAILSTFGWGGVIVIAVLLIYTGRLVPKSLVDALTTQAAKEAAQWKQAYDNSEEARRIERDLVRKALESTEATAKLVRAFNEVAASNEADS